MGEGPWGFESLRPHRSSRGDARHDVLAEALELRELVGERPHEDPLRARLAEGAEALRALLGGADRQRELAQLPRPGG